MSVVYPITESKTEKLYYYLRRAAMQWQVIPYEDVAWIVDLAAHHPPFTSRLGSISQHTWETDRVVLTSLVVRKHDGIPSPAFFEFLKKNLKMEVPDDAGARVTLWAKLVRAVHKKYCQVT